MPGDSGSTLTSKPGFGVAQSTETLLEENDIAALPPTSVNVLVVAAGAGGLVGGAVVGRAVVGGAVVGRAVVGGAVVGRAVVGGAVVGRAVVGGVLEVVICTVVLDDDVVGREVLDVVATVLDVSPVVAGRSGTGSAESAPPLLGARAIVTFVISDELDESDEADKPDEPDRLAVEVSSDDSVTAVGLNEDERGDDVASGDLATDDRLSSFDSKLTAGAGSITWSSTTDTPAQATATAAALPASHNTNNPTCFI